MFFNSKIPRFTVVYTLIVSSTYHSAPVLFLLQGGDTALTWARRGGNDEVIRLLREAEDKAVRSLVATCSITVSMTTAYSPTI